MRTYLLQHDQGQRGRPCHRPAARDADDTFLKPLNRPERVFLHILHHLRMIMVCVAGGTPEHVKADLPVVPLEIMQAGADLLQQAETFQGLLLVSASLP